jgi:hypothetical protein
VITDPDAMTWYGWLKRNSRWRRLVGPFSDMGTTHRALDAEVRRRSLNVRSCDLRLTTGSVPTIGAGTSPPPGALQ